MSEKIEGVVVEGGFGETPAIKFINDQAPEGLVAEVLIQGEGDAIVKGKKLECNYHGVQWGATDPFDSSFLRGESIGFPIGVGMVIKGWDDTLVGQKIGSRVLISIPKEFGYGDRTASMFGNNNPLVFVVDILGQS